MNVARRHGRQDQRSHNGGGDAVEGQRCGGDRGRLLEVVQLLRRIAYVQRLRLLSGSTQNLENCKVVSK